MSQIILASHADYLTEGDLTSLPKPITDMNIAYITTASTISERGGARIQTRKEQMLEHGYNFEAIDLMGKRQEELAEQLANKDLIFVEMGDTFYLLKAINDSGFGDVVKQRLNEGAIYFGASAGSYVACPTIEMATWKHGNKEQYGLTDLKAMNLVDFLVTAHYEPKYEELLRQKIQECPYPVKVLSDGQAILSEDGEIKLVGEGEEINLFEKENLREGSRDKTQFFGPEGR